MKLAIKGHTTRGKEVIQLLEMLGGKPNGNMNGYNDDLYYYIATNGLIYGSDIEYEDLCCKYTLFTLEEFEEEFPYKVGDIVEVLETGKVFSITNMIWEDELSVVHYGDMEDIVYYTADELKPLQENKCLQELKGCLQEFKEYLDNATPEQLEEDWKELEKSSEVGPIADEYVEQYKEGVNLQELERKLDEALKEETMEEKEPEPKAPILSNRYDYAEGKCGYVIPDGYEFDYIKEGFQTEIILKPKKPKYPKTCVECEKILRCFSSVYVDGYKNELLEVFQKLLICRDAYWKIVGEQMELGKPWEPDWDNLSTTHEFIKINKGCFTHSSRVLVFPTPEMRDAFYENFKDLINDCKELL